jgi:hypothetical protein
MSGPYDDILHGSRPVSQKHPPMSRADRAAQFSPFAALTGYEAAVKETARLTQGKIELSDEEKESIDHVLQALSAHLPEQPSVIVTYFLPDQKKDGGAYVTVTGALKRINLLERRLILTDGTLIPIDDISQLQCPNLPEEPIEP